jgi:hypothetical protein
MLKLTGPGRIEVDPKYAGPGKLKALLYNFDFDGDKVKAEHSDFLGSRVVPLLENDRGQIWMQGSASRVGANAYNMELSKRRVRQVADFLKSRGIRETQMQLNAVGEEMAVGHALDDERDRAVALLVYPRHRIDPPPPPQPPKPPPVSSTFKVRLLGEVSVGKTVRVVKLLKAKLGAGPAADAMFFEILDTTNRQSAFYLYVGGGIGAGFMSVSATHVGPWNDFRTSKPISAADFEGFTRFTTAGGGPYTMNFLNMCGTPPGVDDVYLEFFQTGTTFGAGLSTTVGNMWLLQGPLPFSGP